MASMDYCVFENTYSDFCTCVMKLENKEELNQYEKLYKKLLYEAALEYIDAYERLEEEEDDDE